MTAQAIERFIRAAAPSKTPEETYIHFLFGKHLAKFPRYMDLDWEPACYALFKEPEEFINETIEVIQAGFKRRYP
jgi:hypothetical protein